MQLNKYNFLAITGFVLVVVLQLINYLFSINNSYFLFQFRYLYL